VASTLASLPTVFATELAKKHQRSRSVQISVLQTMLKYQKWVAALVVACALWLLLLQFVSTSLDDPRVLQVVYVLPMYALVTFGAYSLAVIAFSVMEVTDCPDAAQELDRQVLAAKEDLRKKGLEI
jgi:dolichyl-phosphate mannosyltransferase polypeptide 3